MSNTTEHYVTFPDIYPSTIDLNSTTNVAFNVTNGTIIWDSPPYHKGLWIPLVVIHIGLPILAIAFCHFMGPNLNPDLASYRRKKKKMEEDEKAKVKAKQDQQQKTSKSNRDDEKQSSKVSKIEDKKSGLEQPFLSNDTAPPQIIKTVASDDGTEKHGFAKKNSPYGIRKPASASAIFFKPHPVNKIPTPSLSALHSTLETPRSMDTLAKPSSLFASKLSSSISSSAALSNSTATSALSAQSDGSNLLASVVASKKSSAVKSVTSDKSRSSSTSKSASKTTKAAKTATKSQKVTSNIDSSILSAPSDGEKSKSSKK